MHRRCMLAACLTGNTKDAVNGVDLHLERIVSFPGRFEQLPTKKNHSGNIGEAENASNRSASP